jgi:r-opsin
MACTTVMYFLPILIIAGCYYFIVQAVFKHEDEMRQQAKKMNVSSLRSGAEQNQVSAEIRIAKIAIMNVSLWITAWTPFAVFCMMGTWGDQSSLTPLASELQCLLAKTSCAYNPIIYCLSHPKFREVFS